MRALAITLLLAVANACTAGAAENSANNRAAADPAPNAASADDFAAECQRNSAQRIPELEQRYGMAIRNGVARLARSTWERMDRYERASLHWPLAFSASCPLGRRGTHKVLVLDEAGRQLAFQIISTSLECHGDHAVIRPEDTEYLC